ncbi:D-2-hydroxyacid dehydrogenase [Terrimonas pollutisoli]|uniref:D-2-hydroxyacid dehydrogenase n=1 Tax=Terrimonas pollutisoli TaxID=3034147 RepID=UPI0023EE1D8E|nr:D-2-hydroxyacid dehydrogenase [Terrimonas sp. H1YJ31]
MKIVVTDGYTLNPGDLSWDSIAACGELVVYDRTPPAEFMDRCTDAEIILTNKVAMNKEAIEQCKKLQLISVLATGYNVIDVKAASDRKIIVCNVPAYGTDSVAQHCFALLLELTNRVGQHAWSVAKGDWQQSPDWCYSVAPIMELAGKTVGIVGFGHIGQQVARVANAFGMQVIYHRLNDKPTTLGRYVDLPTLFASSDIITLHCPLTTGNHQFVNKDLLQRMKRSAYLVNTARGPLIHEQDLADALNNDQIAGAALDVLSTEPPQEGNPLLKAKNCIITPHNAWMSKEARARILHITRNNVVAFLEGQPVNRVN